MLLRTIQCETPLFGELWSVMLSVPLPRVKCVHKETEMCPGGY